MFQVKGKRIVVTYNLTVSKTRCDLFTLQFQENWFQNVTLRVKQDKLNEAKGHKGSYLG